MQIKSIITSLFILLSTFVFSQSDSTKQVVQNRDTILLTKVGTQLDTLAKVSCTYHRMHSHSMYFRTGYLVVENEIYTNAENTIRKLKTVSYYVASNRDDSENNKIKSKGLKLYFYNFEISPKVFITSSYFNNGKTTTWSWNAPRVIDSIRILQQNIKP